MDERSPLQCPGCGGSLTGDILRRLDCERCRREYPVDDGVVYTAGVVQGSNRVAANFYDGPWWRRARVIERLAFAFSGGERRARARILEPLGSLCHKRVLEVAIGDGANLSAMPESCEVYGVDISRVQLRKCRQSWSARRGLRLFHAEAERLPFHARTFDHVVCMGAFNHFTDRRAALLEMLRVARPGGAILIADEAPAVVERLPGRRIGLPGLDRWLLNLVLGPAFAGLMRQHRDLDVEAEARAVLPGFQMEPLQGGTSYRLVGVAP